MEEIILNCIQKHFPLVIYLSKTFMVKTAWDETPPTEVVGQPNYRHLLIKTAYHFHWSFFLQM